MASVVHTHLNEQLAEINGQLAKAAQRAHALVGDLRTYQLNLRPEPERWSIAECLVHLILFSEAFLPVIEAACERARGNSLLGQGPFKVDLIGRVLKLTLEPPARIRLETTDPFKPIVVEPLDDILPRFLARQANLCFAIEQADGLDLNRIKVTSPVSSRIRYNLFSCFVLIAAHQRRHLWQAEQTLKQLSSN